MSEILAFSPLHVCRVTGLSLRQLAYWDRTKFFSPHYAETDRRSPYSRVYSFRDVVSLRTLATLRTRYQVPLQELRNVAAWLSGHGTEFWSSTTFYVLGRHVFFDDPVTGERMSGSGPGQAALALEMDRIVRETEAEIESLRRREPGQLGKVEQHRYVAHNAPVLAGTRVPTSAVWNFRAAGYATDAIIREYPQLTPEDVDAALVFEEQRRVAQAG